MLNPNLCGEVTAGLELLERDGHRVSAEEQDERQHGQIRDVFAGFAHQGTAESQALFLSQLTPVQSREVELRGDHMCSQTTKREKVTVMIVVKKNSLSSPQSNQRCFLGLMERKC